LGQAWFCFLERRDCENGAGGDWVTSGVVGNGWEGEILGRGRLDWGEMDWERQEVGRY